MFNRPHRHESATVFPASSPVAAFASLGSIGLTFDQIPPLPRHPLTFPVLACFFSTSPFTSAGLSSHPSS